MVKKINTSFLFPEQNTFMHLSDIINHLGENNEDYFNALTPPLIQSSNFSFPTVAAFRTAKSDEKKYRIYSRGNNPTVEILRKKLAALEKTDDAVVFGSGSAAIANAIIGLVQSGDHIISVAEPYNWTFKLFEKFLKRFGISTTYVDGKNNQAFVEAIQPNTKLIFLESPVSHTFEVQDLSFIAQLARSKGILTCIDNSYATPIFQNPAEFGIDIIIHSLSKFINGHGDAMGGAICGSQSLIDQLFKSEYMTLGGILSANDAALILRGLRTLEIRMERGYQTARKLVAFLEKQPQIKKIYYPLSTNNPQYELASLQMKGTGALFSFELNTTDIRVVEHFTESLQKFKIAVSWGGAESLILPMAAYYQVEGKTPPKYPFNLVRIYAGLEEVDYLIDDLKRALLQIT
jgi:cystathionine beta-lyase/cystathionine gamma-synthase